MLRVMHPLQRFDQIQRSKGLERKTAAPHEGQHDVSAEAAEQPVGAMPIQRSNDTVAAHFPIERPRRSTE